MRAGRREGGDCDVCFSGRFGAGASGKLARRQFIAISVVPGQVRKRAPVSFETAS